MARPNQAPGEGKAPLVIALAFFILTTLVLGVLTYMAYDQVALVRSEAKKDAEGKAAAEKLRSGEQERVYLYKAALGIASQEELNSLKEARNEADIRKEHANLLTEINNKLKGTDVAPGLVSKASKDFIGVKFDVTANDVVKWNWPEGTKLGEPEKSIVEAVVNSYARAQLAIAKAAAELRTADQAKTAYKAGLDDAEKSKQKFADDASKFPAQVNKAQADAKAEAKATRDLFGKTTKDYIETTRTKDEALGAKDIKIADLERIISGLREQVAAQDAKLETREDPFAFDKPHGKIIKRKGNVVDIDLGSSANVRPGLTFTVQPSDTPERGLATRMRELKDKNGRVIYDSIGADKKAVMEIVPKGTIEVIEVLGPNLAQARITGQTDPVREGLMVGDVLYNSTWRPGASDHVALFGVFDIDGDGTDDIKQVIRDLNKMGVTVDTYFDLDQRKWVRPLDSQTIYAIEGAYPASSGVGVDALAAAKGAIETALRDARQQAKEKGAKVIRARDFFPRIGYRIKLDINPDTINRAYNRYLQVAPPADAEPAKN